MEYTEPHCKWKTNRQEIEKIFHAYDPLFLGGHETKAHALDTAQQERRQCAGANQHQMAENAHSLYDGRCVDGMEDATQQNGGEQGEKERVESGHRPQHDIPEGNGRYDRAQSRAMIPAKFACGNAVEQIGEHRGNGEYSRELGARNVPADPLAGGLESRDQIEWVLHEERGDDGNGRPQRNIFLARVYEAGGTQPNPAGQQGRPEGGAWDASASF